MDQSVFFGWWPSSLLALNITVPEWYPIVAAVELWDVSSANNSVCLFIDNEALCDGFSSQVDIDMLAL